MFEHVGRLTSPSALPLGDGLVNPSGNGITVVVVEFDVKIELVVSICVTYWLLGLAVCFSSQLLWYSLFKI